MKNFYFFVGIFLLALFTLHSSVADAAEIYFGAHNPAVGVGSIFEVGVFLNTEGQSINAVEGRILFPDDLVRLTEVRDGNSFLSLWMQRPEVPASAEGLLEAQQEVFFSGLVPGGFTGEDGYLFSLFFEAIQKGQARVEISAEQILLADGQGSKAVVKQAPLVLSIEDSEKVNELPFLDDSDPPAPFTPQVARDATLFDGKWFLVFAAQDKGYGISHYEVQENEGAWKRAASPYLLEDQNLRSSLAVKAVDRTGNERIETLAPQNPAKWYENWIIWGIISGIGIAFLFGAIGKILWKKKTQRGNEKL